MARLRRMYARLLFVVVGISGAVLARFDALPPVSCQPVAHGLCGTAPWHRRGLRIYAGGMNEAIRPGPENPPLTAGLPQLSVVVPTFNERENVTTLLRRLETALAGRGVGSHLCR